MEVENVIGAMEVSINNWISVFVGTGLNCPLKGRRGQTIVDAFAVVAVATTKAIECCSVSSPITLGNKGKVCANIENV